VLPLRDALFRAAFAALWRRLFAGCLRGGFGAAFRRLCWPAAAQSPPSIDHVVAEAGGAVTHSVLRHRFELESGHARIFLYCSSNSLVVERA